MYHALVLDFICIYAYALVTVFWLFLEQQVTSLHQGLTYSAASGISFSSWLPAWFLRTPPDPAPSDRTLAMSRSRRSSSSTSSRSHTFSTDGLNTAGICCRNQSNISSNPAGLFQADGLQDSGGHSQQGALRDSVLRRRLTPHSEPQTHS